MKTRVHARHRVFSMFDSCKELLGGELMHIGSGSKSAGTELIGYVVRMQVPQWRRCVGLLSILDTPEPVFLGCSLEWIVSKPSSEPLIVLPDYP